MFPLLVWFFGLLFESTFFDELIPVVIMYVGDDVSAFQEYSIVFEINHFNFIDVDGTVFALSFSPVNHAEKYCMGEVIPVVSVHSVND